MSCCFPEFRIKQEEDQCYQCSTHINNDHEITKHAWYIVASDQEYSFDQCKYKTLAEVKQVERPVIIAFNDILILQIRNQECRILEEI